MSKVFTITVGTDSTSGPFPPSYPPGAVGYIATASNPSGSFAGTLFNATTNLYYGAQVIAIANDSATPVQFMVALLGAYDVSFLGTITTPDGKSYLPANATFAQYQVGAYITSCWMWPLATGGSLLVGGSVTFGNTGDTLLNLTGASSSSTQINLSWTNSGPTPPANYLLYRGVGSTTPTLYQTLAGTVLAYADTGLAAQTAYNYYVVASYADGTSASSVQIQEWTPASGISQTFNCNCDFVSPDGWTVDTLAGIRKRVIIRGGYAAQANNPPPGMVALVNEFVQDAQRQLYRQHSEFRNVRMYSWQMEPNQRYYGLTADESGCGQLDPLSVQWVGFEDLNQAWYYLTAGIDPIMYTRAQISNGWPTHYEIRSCIEIFPAPKAPYTLWIKGRFGLQSFVNDTDQTTIDAEAIYLLALGMFKAHYGQIDAQAVLAQAMSYTKYLVAGQHLTKRYIPRTRSNSPLTPPKFIPVGNG